MAHKCVECNGNLPKEAASIEDLCSSDCAKVSWERRMLPPKQRRAVEARQNNRRMSRQEIFDKVAKHLLRQRERSTGGTYCLYRSPSGLKCAAGCLIDNVLYRDLFEKSMLLEEVLRECGFLIRQITLIEGLQSVHDQHPVSSWPGKLVDLALMYNLDCSAAIPSG